MRILVLSPYLPHPLSGHGTGVMIDGMIRHLLPRHQVTLVSFCDLQEMQLAEDVKKLPMECHFVERSKGKQRQAVANLALVFQRLWQMVQSIVRWEPYYISKYRHRAMANLLEQLTTDVSYDIVQIEMAYMAQYVKNIRRGKKVLHEHDFTFRPAYRRWKRARSAAGKMIAFFEWCRWASYEKAVVKKFDRILCVTEQDKELMRRLFSVDHVSYFPRGIEIPASIPKPGARERHTLLFVGSFSHPPNDDAATWLADEIFPRVLQNFPDAVLYIAGANPSKRLLELAGGNSRIRVLNFVSELEPYYRLSSVFAAPLRFGGGIKVKILNALAHGMPVVTTKIGAEGIEKSGSESILIGNSADELAGRICALFSDDGYADRIAQGSVALIRDHYSLESVSRTLESIYNETLRKL